MAVGPPFRMSSSQRNSERSLPFIIRSTSACSQAGHAHAEQKTASANEFYQGSSNAAASSSSAPVHHRAQRASLASRDALHALRISVSTPPLGRTSTHTSVPLMQSLPCLRVIEPSRSPLPVSPLAGVPPTHIAEDVPSRRSQRLRAMLDTPSLSELDRGLERTKRVRSASEDARSLSDWYAHQDDQALSAALTPVTPTKKQSRSRGFSVSEGATVNGAVSERNGERLGTFKLTRATLALLGEASFRSEHQKYSVSTNTEKKTKWPRTPAKTHPTEEFDIGSRSPSSSVSATKRVAATIHSRMSSGALDIQDDRAALLLRIAKLESMIDEDHRDAWGNISWTDVALVCVFAHVAYRRFSSR